jgi:branched-chain amino acid transport system ATP-binding protein
LLLEARDISVYYGSVRAIEDISFHVDPGEIVAMIGPNGAGKSTALKAVFGLVALKTGEVLFGGEPISALRPDERVAKGISLVPENRRIFPSMTVVENLEMGTFIKKGVNPREEVEKILDLFPPLKARMGLKGGVLSTGEQQMLAMGRALIQHPRLLLTDEPSSGLSPSYMDIIFEKLIEISRSGISILLVEQNARMALDIAHRGYVFKVGGIYREDTGRNLLEDKEISRIYFG